MKNYILMIVGIAVSVGVAATVARAEDESPLRIYCNRFDDTWFTTMQYINGYCYPGTWGGIPVTRADAEFNASLNIGFIGENESISKMDEQFRTDFDNNLPPFGTKEVKDNTEIEFIPVSLGDYAIKTSHNSWASVLDLNNNGKLLGHRQEITIGYIVRQGRCYATFGVQGYGPMESRLYYGTVAPKAGKEIEEIAQKMKDIGICGSAGPYIDKIDVDPDKFKPDLTPPAPSTAQPKQTGPKTPAKEEVEQFIKDNFLEYNPPAESESPKGGFEKTVSSVNAVPALVEAVPSDNDLIERKTGYVEWALVEAVPSDNDLMPPPITEAPIKPGTTAIIEAIDGNADMQLADGTWVALEKGMSVPADAKVFTGYDVTMTLRLSDNLIITMESLTEFNMSLWQTKPRQAYTDAQSGESMFDKPLKIQSGALRFKVDEDVWIPFGNMSGHSQMQVETPKVIAGVVGTDFSVSHIEGKSIVEIYDGTVEVTVTATGETKKITSQYGSGIKRVEVGDDNIMVEKTSVPQKKSDEPETGNSFIQEIGQWWWVWLAVLFAAGAGYILYRNGLLKKSSAS